MGVHRSKLSIVREHMTAGRWQEALRIAARFPQLGEHKAAIVAAHEAYAHPGFYVQLGRDLDSLKEAGKRALISRFGE